MNEHALQDNQFTRDMIPPLPGAEPEAIVANSIGTMKRGVFPRFFLNNQRLANGEIHHTEMVELRIAGDKNNAPVRKVTDRIRHEYSEAYVRFRRGLDSVAEGTPLEEWAQILPTEIDALKVMNVYSVEQLAEVPDTGIQQLMGGMQLRAKAAAFLAERDGRQTEDNTADILRLQTELQTKDNDVEMLRSQIADIQAVSDQANAIVDENAMLKARLAELEKNPTGKAGNSKKGN